MKKYAFILLAGGFLGLAACGDNKNTTTQEQIDSTVNARSAALEAEAKAKNDSLINAMARMRADSAMMADSLAKLGMTKKSVTTKVTTTTTPALRPGSLNSTRTERQSEQDRKFQQMGGKTDTKVTTEISKEKKKEQDDKFNQMGGR